METLSKLQLFYFDKNFTKPIVFFVIKITSNNEEIILEENTQHLFKILLENKLSNNSDILIFNIIKEHKSKIINWILPSKNSNKKLLKQIENNQHLVNEIVSETIKNSNCNTLISLEEEQNNNLKIFIRDCDVNLGFLTNIYY
jgi:hypothetical protein